MSSISSQDFTLSAAARSNSGVRDSDFFLSERSFVLDCVRNQKLSLECPYDAARFADFLQSCRSSEKKEMLKLIEKEKFALDRFREAVQLSISEGCFETITVPLMQFVCESSFAKQEDKAAAAKFCRCLYYAPNLMKNLSQNLDDLSETSRHALYQFLVKVASLIVDARASAEMRLLSERIIATFPEKDGGSKLSHRLLCDSRARRRAEQIESVDFSISADATFMNHDFISVPDDGSSNLILGDPSEFNHREAELVIAFCRHTFLQGKTKPRQMIILTPSSEQLVLLNREAQKLDAEMHNLLVLQECNLDISHHGEHSACTRDYDLADFEWCNIPISTFEDFDTAGGSYVDVTVISLAVSSRTSDTNHISHSKFVTKLLSETDRKLFIFGSCRYILQKVCGEECWGRIFAQLKNIGRLVDGIASVCSVHREDETFLSDGGSFALERPYGGCKRPCQSRLECGHKCGLSCHGGLDKHHKLVKCRRPCGRFPELCPHEHECKKLCFEDCGECESLVACELPVCHHEKTVSCFKSQKPELLLFERCNFDVGSSGNFGDRTLGTCSASRSLSMKAMRVCERVRGEFMCRTEAERNAGAFSDATNFDSCLKFLTLRQKWRKTGRFSRDTSPKDIDIRIVFHGTAPSNLSPIISENLKIPDGKKVRVKHGSVYGKGIYVAEDHTVSFGYSSGSPVIACLAIVGQTGVDTLPGGGGQGKPIYVLQNESQVFPCVTTAQANIDKAMSLLSELAKIISEEDGRYESI